MSRKKRQRKSKGPHVQVPKAIMATPAWRTMSPWARLLWIDLRGWLRNDDLNNGKVHRACRKAAEAIGANKDTIARRFVELEHFGFLRRTAEGFLGSDGRGIAAKYRFTDLAYGTHPPTREYEKWDRTPFVYTPRRPGRKKQKPVLSRRTVRIVPSDIRKAPGKGSVCIAPSDIGEPPRCPVPSDISRLPPHAAAVGQDQGSSTVRAPACAGEAGSSPAPDTKPDLTTMVLEIVHAQLVELETCRTRRPVVPHNGPVAVSASERTAPPDTPMSIPERANGSPTSIEPGPKEESSPQQIRRRAEWWDDQVYRVFSPAQIAAGLHDEALRRRLAEDGVSPERIEIEFQRVMKAVRS